MTVKIRIDGTLKKILHRFSAQNTDFLMFYHENNKNSTGMINRLTVNPYLNHQSLILQSILIFYLQSLFFTVNPYFHRQSLFLTSIVIFTINPYFYRQSLFTVYPPQWLSFLTEKHMYDFWKLTREVFKDGALRTIEFAGIFSIKLQIWSCRFYSYL